MFGEFYPCIDCDEYFGNCGLASNQHKAWCPQNTCCRRAKLRKSIKAHGLEIANRLFNSYFGELSQKGYGFATSPMRLSTNHYGPCESDIQKALALEGDVVEAFDETTSLWMEAKLHKINYDGMCRVYWADDEYATFSDLSPHLIHRLFKVDDIVEVLGFGIWKEAAIHTVNLDGTYTVGWIEGDYIVCSDFESHQIRYLFQVGDFVKAAYGRMWQEAKIKSVHRDGSYTVLWARDKFTTESRLEANKVLAKIVPPAPQQRDDAQSASKKTASAKLSGLEEQAQARIILIHDTIAAKHGAALKCELQRLRLQWHPDKNRENQKLATIVFEFIQTAWEQHGATLQVK